jgi:hypothetical protein
MMSLLPSWTAHQWGLFTSLTMIGLGLLLAAGVIVHRMRWNAAEMAVIRARWDAAQRGDNDELRRLNDFGPAPAMALVAGTVAMPLYANDPPHVDPTVELLEVAAHVAPGPGSLTSLREVGPGALTAAEPAIDPEVAAWFDAALDPILDDFRAILEPAMRKARLWELRGYAGQGAAPSARAALDAWRINTPTGEWPLVSARAESTVDLTARHRALAEALLVAV